jgi:hypothetical protein
MRHGFEAVSRYQKLGTGIRMFSANMIGPGPIVCGGGWKSRRDCRIALWRMVLLLLLCMAALGLANWIGVWGFLIPAALFVVLLIPLRNTPEPEEPAARPKASLPNLPKHDLHNLH